MNRITAIGGVLFAFAAMGQSYAPAPGQVGSTAVHKDSNVIVSWATDIQVQRGFLDIAQPGLGLATYGENSMALGQAEGDGTSVVSLGDGGVATLTFSGLIFNGEGPDFAVFENGFADNYMEFAHVEVSSDGVNFFRFPSVSETPQDVQLNNFSFGDCRYIHNLAGKYRQGFGTPFDLEDLAGISGLDVNSVSHVRLIDVVGSINVQWGTTDSEGNLINDPYPTNFESGGFDLDAVGVIHQLPLGIIDNSWDVMIYPNPAKNQFSVIYPGGFEVRIYDLLGKERFVQMGTNEVQIDAVLPEGIYFCRILNHDRTIEKQIRIQH